MSSFDEDRQQKDCCSPREDNEHQAEEEVVREIPTTFKTHDSSQEGYRTYANMVGYEFASESMMVPQQEPLNTSQAPRNDSPRREDRKESKGKGRRKGDGKGGGKGGKGKRRDGKGKGDQREDQVPSGRFRKISNGKRN